MILQVVNRRGTSLAEVLIALVVLSIGLTSVIALFPVGINRVRNATLDTRTTLMAISAPDTFQLKRMGNDSELINWNVFDRSTVHPAFDLYRTNKYAFVPPATGFGLDLVSPGLPTNPATHFQLYLSADADEVPRQPVAPDLTLPVRGSNSDYNMSYPILLDPFLYDQIAINLRVHSLTSYALRWPRGVPRINIATPLLDATGNAVVGDVFRSYYADGSKWGGSPPAIPYCDVPVATLSEIDNIPWIEPNLGTVQAWRAEREMVKTRWFASTSDVQNVVDLPGVVRNPSARDYLSASSPGGPLLVQDYYQPRGLNGSRPMNSNPVRPTASRVYEYSWAAMIQRRLIKDPEATSLTPVPGNPAVGRPNHLERDFRGKLAIMCFYRRNLNQPYTVIEGCFYNGSRKVTLSWPTTGISAPTVNVGTWLCEASISRSTYTEPAGAPFNGACNRQTGFYNQLDTAAPFLNAKRHYRRSFSFHRVVEVGQQQIVGNRVYLEVIVERPALGFPLRWVDATSLSSANQDQRSYDAYPVSGVRWPIFDPELPTGYDEETNQSQATGSMGVNAQPVQYYPVIIFDGLREVFEREL